MCGKSGEAGWGLGDPGLLLSAPVPVLSLLRLTICHLSRFVSPSILSLGLSCLNLSLSVPLSIFIPAVTAALRSSLGRGLLGRPGWRDSELLRQCRGSEQALWGLPCSWVQVPAHAWGHSEELAKVVRGRILQEQARLVWVERGSGRGGSSSSSEA